uniref:Uncharacterized protein n=1 Tax=Salarias fasciatus TaxID=181472 RepID=A0A672JSC0_SALFA
HILYVIFLPAARCRAHAVMLPKQYEVELHEDRGKLSCRNCNKILDHTRNSTIKDHLSSASHLKRKSETPADVALKRQTTITTSLRRRTVAAEEREKQRRSVGPYDNRYRHSYLYLLEFTIRKKNRLSGLL